MARARTGLAAALLALAAMPGAAAPVAGALDQAPKPIPAPPIPKPPKLAPAPAITLGPSPTPARPEIDMPAAPVLTPVTIPAPPPMTPADPADPVPPPLPGTRTGPPPPTSPGADRAQVEESAFIVDPGSSVIPASARAKIQHMAQSLRAAPLARIEIRAYSPVKGPESTARRLSLARMVAVRDILVANGVADDRIDGRALASGPNETNPDRIELYLER